MKSNDMNKIRSHRVRRTTLCAFATVAFFALAGVASAQSIQEQRDSVRSAANDTLNRLYSAQPGSREAIAKAAGYGVFNDFGMKILFAGGGTGKGLVVNNRTKQETFMKMIEVQAGLGLGIDKYRLVWVFEQAADLNQFINQGWELGAQATMTAQAGGQGVQGFTGAVAVTPGVWLYQLTDTGLAVDLTAGGTKYFRDPDLN